jgi:hypothetical protein
MDLCLQLGERFNLEHELEASRGWSALALLRDAAAQARRIAQEAGLAPEAGPLPREGAKVSGVAQTEEDR